MIDYVTYPLPLYIFSSIFPPPQIYMHANPCQSINWMVGTSMSCNGCRILRKGCNDDCILRQSLEAFDTPQAQANATLFVAKFFGRAALLSFLSSAPLSQRPAVFQSLLFEACGRTVNPVTGAVGLLSTGKWHACQSAVEMVLQGGALHGNGNNNNVLYGSEYLDNETAAGMASPSSASSETNAALDGNHDTNILRLFF